MKAGYTEIAFIWDKSGSMCYMYADALGGFNSFVQDQKKDNDDTRLTLIQFDHEVDEVFTSKPISEIKEFTNEDYKLRGSTALLDAVGSTINRLGKRLSDMDETERPENVIVVIQTDGEENSSREFTNTQIQDMIKHQEEKYNWDIVYLGANASAFSSNNNIGIAAHKLADYSNSTTTAAYSATSARIKDIKAGLDLRAMASYLADADASINK